VRAHVVSRQAGSAFPLIHLSRLLSQQGYSVENFVFQSSRDEFLKQSLECIEIQNFADYSAKTQCRPDLILTGTAFEGEDDQLFWHYAHEVGARSIAWLDQAINLDKRFPNRADSRYLPQVILAFNKDCLQEVLNWSLPVQCTYVGSPYLDHLLKVCARTEVDDQPSIYFATEPMGKRQSNSFRAENGYDDIDSFIMARKAVLTLNERDQSGWQLKVKLHPRDNRSEFEGALSERSGEVISVEYTDEDKIAIFNRAHAVFGMHSMFLYEAAWVGVPTVSFQPRRKKNCVLLDPVGEILTLVDEVVNSDLLRTHLRKKLSRQDMTFQPNKFLELCGAPLLAKRP